jgi:hypothetical protein
MAIHLADPQTLAYAMTASPVGQAAWMLERRRARSDCAGDVEQVGRDAGGKQDGDADVATVALELEPQCLADRHEGVLRREVRGHRRARRGHPSRT